MSYTMFDPSKATELAEFQGRFAGIQAGNATITGVAMAPTSIYNQAGYYALQDSDTGYVTLQKLADDSLYTQQWYDQGTGTIFDFSNGGAGIVSTKPTTNQNNSMSAATIAGTYGNTTNSSSSTTNSSSTTTNSTSNSTNSTNLQQYPYGPGYVVYNPNGGETNNTTTNADGSTTNQRVDEDGNPIEITASELQELVDAGIYETVEEALNATLEDGYTVTDEEQKKLGIYSKEDEEKIELMMETYGLTRDEAIEKLGDQVGPIDDANDISAKIYSMIENGFTYEEAVDYLQELGYDVPAELQTPPEQYSEEDEAKIAALMDSTGCSREEAISALGVKPVEEDKPGLIRSAVGAIGDFIGGIGKAISDGWNAFVDWIW